ncbi:MAG: XRE family transcriptional regulator [Bacteroidales bacterium]|nr:XRE family transcriptional regulator [Bacteroidales bacterium]MBR4637652.1 XRE family transcriptional regulator [Bacteroidales bacterium]MBR6175954.1 XRE family transcriptional regulator [Bacteroidales bacterium]
MHIGHLIRNVLDEKRISVRQFAMMANSERTNMYRILDRESIDLSVLERYSCILDHNFFQDLSDEYKKQYKNS